MKIITLVVLVMLLPATLSMATTHTISFINFPSFQFVPANITISLGDTIQFSLSAMHNAAEVSFATWQANGVTSNGGFSVPFGGGSLVLQQMGTYYYVCQNHGPFGMKGIITVDSAQNSLTIMSSIDQDGNIVTTGDRILKNWNLKLYKDSINSGIVIDSVLAGNTLTVNALPPGTYVAAEDDSIDWQHRSVHIDGISQGTTTVNHWSITVTSGESHTIEFINYAPHTIINSGLTFTPESLAVNTGDKINFVLEIFHEAREVSEATWLANDTTSNGGFEVPDGGGSIILTQTGIHYYVCKHHVSLGMKGKIIVFPPPVVVKMLPGWNMVSIPVLTPVNYTSTLFPTAISSAFSYQGSYTQQTILTMGLGYWLKFNDSPAVSINGFTVLSDTVDVQNGWNMVGSISDPLAKTTVTSLPPGIINSNFFGFNGAYYSADTLRPGLGYWVKVNQLGKLILSSGPAAGHSLIGSDVVRREASMIIIRDAVGNEQTLYVIHRDAETPATKFFSELPPLPPQGAFDVRFVSGRQLEMIDANASTDFPIQISSAVYPLNVRWNVFSQQHFLTLLIDGSRRPLSESGMMSIVTAPHVLFLGVSPGSVLPKAYTLHPAYPNPFNPSTIIRYDLPVESNVRIRVYNVLGQLVATPIDRVQNAGEKSISWNAERNGSGIYFIRLDAVSTAENGRSFSQISKVVLQK
jgi:plastocyanin